MTHPWFRGCLAALVALTSVSNLDAAAPKNPALKCVDVALQAPGTLAGQLVDRAGQPIAGAKVWLVDGRSQPVSATTNQQGAYRFAGLKTGVYSLQTGDALQVCRIWTHKAAPPKALQGVLLVANEQAVRAQFSAPPVANGLIQGAKQFFASPAGAVTIAAAIAAPIAIEASKDDPVATP